MPLVAQVQQVLSEVLSLNGCGAATEFDSVALLAAMEDRFGIVVQDDDVNGDMFATVDALVQFDACKLDA